MRACAWSGIPRTAPVNRTVLKAVGLTPRQVVSTIVGSYALLAVPASVLALPLGVALYLSLYAVANGSTDGAVLASWWSLALIPVGTVLVVLVATSLPAWQATQIRTADALRYE